MPIVVVPGRFRFPNLMDSKVVNPLSEFMDVTLHVLAPEALLSRNSPDLVFIARADRYSLGSIFMWCSMESTALMCGGHALDRFQCNSPSARGCAQSTLVS